MAGRAASTSAWASPWQKAGSSSSLRAQSSAHPATSCPKPTSLAPAVKTTIRTSSRRATAASWSACGDSPKWGRPPSAAGQTFASLAPEQARLTFSSTGTGALLTGATSERWQPSSSLAP